MSLQQIVRTAALATSLAFISAGASAGEKHDHDHGHDRDGEHRQHGTHVHGVAALNLVLEGNEVYIELDSPAANIVGFEHAPSSDDEHAALDKAVAMLKDGDQLFQFDQGAGCRMEKATVTSELLDDEHEGAHEKKEGHDHDGHPHEHAGDGETHADIHADYHFTCDAPNKLERLSVELFEAFSGMEALKVQYVTESEQGAAELTAKDQVVKF